MSDLKIYAQNLESAAMEQIETLASAPAFDYEAKTMESEDDGVLLG